jgi:type IV secretory pathway VirB3-like protein
MVPRELSLMDLVLTLAKLTAPSIIFGGTAWIFVEKGMVEGLIFLFCTSFAYCIFIILYEYLTQTGRYV